VWFNVENVQYEEVGRMQSTLMGWLKGNNRAGRVFEGCARLCTSYARFSNDLVVIDASFWDAKGN
jgi:hypothetical protein